MHNDEDLNQSTKEIDWTDFDTLWDDFVEVSIVSTRSGRLKRQAKLYLGIENVRFIDRKTNRELVAKKRKLRKSSIKSQRAKTHALTKQINWFMESNRKR